MNRPLSIFLLTLITIYFHQCSSQAACPLDQFLLTTTNTCVPICPGGTYASSQGTESLCLLQKPISFTIRPTVEERSFLVIFNDTQLPFSNSPEFQRDFQVSILPILDGSQNQVDVTVVFLAPDIVKMSLVIPELTQETAFQLEFPDYRLDITKPSYIISPVQFSSLPFVAPGKDLDTINALTRLDRGLEYTWIAITCLNPYAFLYMNTKLYRETLEIFKRTNVMYGPMATSFFRRNNNKVSGLKAANMFSILLMNTPVSSGWDREEENLLPIPGSNVQRAEDLKLSTINQSSIYEPYPLFLDGYGIQIAVFLAFIVLIIVFEAANLIIGLLKKNEKISLAEKIFQAIRGYLRWNILIASIIGSYQTLMYFFMLQMKVMALEEGEKSNHNLLNFWFAIGTFIILVVAFLPFLAYKLIKIYRAKKVEESSNHYEILSEVFNFKRPKALSFIFVLMLRTVIFAALTVFLDYNPIAQVSVMLGFSVAFVLFFLIARPFLKTFYTVFQLLNELVLIAYLCVLIFLAQQGEKDHLDNTEGLSTGDVLIAFWLLIPTLGITFGLFHIIVHVLQHRKQKTSKGKYVAPVSAHLPQDQQIESGQRLPEDIRLEGDKEMLTPKAQVDAENNETLSLPLPIVNETIDHDIVEPTQEMMDSGKKTFQFESTPSRKAFPNLSYIDKIETIIEDVEKEQASANLKEELRKKKRTTRDNTANNSMVRSDYDFATRTRETPKGIELGSRDPLKTSKNLAGYIDANNVSRYGNIDSDHNRTQDRIKAVPLALDVPTRKSSRVFDGWDRHSRTSYIGGNNSFISAQPSNPMLTRLSSLEGSNNKNSTLDLRSTGRSQPLIQEGFKTVNKRLIFDES